VRQTSLTTGPAVRVRENNRAWIALFYLVSLAIFARVFTLPMEGGLRPWYLAMQAAFLLLFTISWWPGLPCWAHHLLLAAQGALVFAMLSLNPEREFVSGLFVALSYQSALVFSGRARWWWVGTFVFLIGFSLMLYLGPLRGLAFAFIPMAFGIVLPAYATARAELEASREEGEHTILQLEATNRQLQAYAEQAEELAGMEERNRLARELHDSVSQTMFSIQLGARTAQMLLEKNPGEVRPQLEHLQQLAQGALRHMRSLIADLDTGRGDE
jgi:signal transduction histidine kinase